MAAQRIDEEAGVTSEQKEQFDRDGFFVLESTGCPDDLLDRILADLETLYGPPREENGVVYRRKRVRNAWKLSENVRALALAPTVLKILEELYGRKPLALQTLNFKVPTEQRPHSDAMHFNSAPRGYMCGVWVALEDIDMDNGPLVYYPGSHKLPEPSIEEAVPIDQRDYPDFQSFMSERERRYEDYVAGLVESQGLEPQYGTIRRGEAIFWASHLLHGGAACKDPGRSRHSQVTHYFFEGCRYYNPMVSLKSNISWLDPEWVS